MLPSDLIAALECEGAALAFWNLIAAMQHYFRFDDSYHGSLEVERQAVNQNIQGNRNDGYANLKRFARLGETHCGSKILTAQLHTLVCRIFDQELAQGCVARLGEMFMERAVSAQPHTSAPNIIFNTVSNTQNWAQVRMFSKTVKAIGSAGPEQLFVKQFAIQVRVGLEHNSS